MNYLKCPSCGVLFANRYAIIRKEFELINSDYNTTNEEKEQKKTEFKNSLLFERYCCKSKIFNVPNLINVINSKNENI
jgi:DNA-directed RNA polymerase subunit N (RpoN/RPB10)